MQKSASKSYRAGSDDSFLQSYEKDKSDIKTLLLDLSEGETGSIENVLDIANSVYARNEQNMDIINCITQIRNVDEYAYYCINVSMLAMLIGKWLQLEPIDIHMLVQAGLLHDVGKSLIPGSIIKKPANSLKMNMKGKETFTIWILLN